jgi:hypothetical protein
MHSHYIELAEYKDNSSNESKHPISRSQSSTQSVLSTLKHPTLVNPAVNLILEYSGIEPSKENKEPLGEVDLIKAIEAPIRAKLDALNYEMQPLLKKQQKLISTITHEKCCFAIGTGLLFSLAGGLAGGCLGCLCTCAATPALASCGVPIIGKGWAIPCAIGVSSGAGIGCIGVGIGAADFSYKFASKDNDANRVCREERTQEKRISEQLRFINNKIKIIMEGDEANSNIAQAPDTAQRSTGGLYR